MSRQISPVMVGGSPAAAASLSGNPTPNSPPSAAATPASPAQPHAYKRPNLRSAEEGLLEGCEVEEDEEDEDAPLTTGWPTRAQLMRRLALSWRMLRLGTVLQMLVALIVALLLVRFVAHRVADRSKANHFSVVALLRDMSASSLSAAAAGQDRWQFAFQWSALMSWSEVLVGRNILVFVDHDDTCHFLEGQVRDIQCFVIPADACFHPEYRKPRLDCIFSVAHAQAPTDTIVYINADVLIGPDLSAAISVVQSKHERFVLAGRRTDLAVTPEMLEQFRTGDFVSKLRHTARTAGHLHNPTAIDLLVYQRSEFERVPQLSSFPPLIAAAPHWEAWFFSLAVLDKTVASIDLSSTVLLVHLDRGKVVRAAPRVGSAYNEDLVRSLAGNAWKVGQSINNADLALVGDCQQGAANVIALPPESDATTMAPTVVDATGPGCYFVVHPNATDAVLFTKRASPQGVLAVLTVNNAILPAAVNWLCWAERIKFTHFVVLAEDLTSAAKMRARGVPVVVSKVAPMVKPQSSAVDSELEAGSAETQEAMRFRSEFLLSVLNGGFSFLSASVEAVWLEDPLPHLDPRIDLQGRALDDASGDNEQFAPGFLAVRATTYGRHFWGKVAECQRVALSLPQVESGPVANLAQATEQRCINDLAASLRSQPLFTRRLLDPYLFPSGASFFDEHAPQLRGVTSVLVANDAQGESTPTTTEARQRRLREWGLHSTDEDTDECLAAESFPRPDFSKKSKDFRLKIRVLTYNRPESLKRLLTSLAAADYLGDSITLEISVDHPLPTPDDADVAHWNDATEVAQAFSWAHGKKLVIEQPHNIGLVGQWTRGWVPAADDRELCLFLEDDVSLSPDFYLWLKPAVEKYYLDPKNFDPRMFGLSLMRQHTILGESHTVRYGSRTPSDVLSKMDAPGLSKHVYRYQLLGTHGAVFFPGHWRSFLAWLEANQVDTISGTSVALVPCVPTLLSNRWWTAGPHRTWTQWFVRFAYERGLYGLYANFADGGALAINHREAGLNFAKAKGAMHGWTNLTQGKLDLPNLKSTPLFDFHFNRVKRGESLAWRKSLTNDKFIGAPPVTTAVSSVVLTPAAAAAANQQCWTLEQLHLQLKQDRIAAAEAAAAAKQAALVAAQLALEAEQAKEAAAKKKLDDAAQKKADDAKKKAAGGDATKKPTAADTKKADAKKPAAKKADADAKKKKADPKAKSDAKKPAAKGKPPAKKADDKKKADAKKGKADPKKSKKADPEEAAE